MKRNHFSLILFLLIGFLSKAQTDYLITNQNDTLVGKVRTNFAFFGQKIWVKNEFGKTTFKYNDVKSFRQRGRVFERVIYPDRKGRMQSYHCHVIAEGKLRFLSESYHEIAENFLIFEGKTYRLTKKYFPEELWSKLITCAKFNEAYGNYHKSSGGNWMFFPKQMRVWREMVVYYNQYCGRD